MIYLISFLMLGINRSGEILKYLKSQTQGGDLRTLHYFIKNIAQRINLPRISNPKQIILLMKQNCKILSDKPWFNVIVRVMKKAKDLLKLCPSNRTTSNWPDILSTLITSYKSKIFFNQSIFGGNKRNYEKIRKQSFCFQQKEKISDETIYKLYRDSLVFNEATPPSVILSLSSSINPQNECDLNICEVIGLNDIKEEIQIVIIGSQCQLKFFKGNQPMKEKDLFNNLQAQIRSKYKNVNINKNFPRMELIGNFQSLSQTFKDSIQNKRRNVQLKIDIKKILQDAIAKRQAIMQKNPKLMLAVIAKQYSLSLLEQLTNFDMKKMFRPMKTQMSNNYGVEIEWNSSMSETLLIVKNSKNIHISRIIEKLVNFCSWFADSQTIVKEQLKIKPQMLEDSKFLSKDDKGKIMERVNQIVDSKLDHHIIKGWATGSGPSTKFHRTGKMIAVCWVLTNMFNCIVKGGFVRDWVVNKDQVLPAGINLPNLLQINKRNNFLQVLDEKVTPSDIDAELSDFPQFNKQKFIKQMKKIGIPVIIEEDGWRKHVIFDKDSYSGGFTADLIEPYTSMCHDTYDFDVNILYIKKDHLNAIGQKIPYEYLNNHGQKIKINLEQLLSQCRSKQMRKLKEIIPEYRYRKFQDRGWTINKQQVYQPLIYTDYTTKSSPILPNSIQNICPVFHQKMVVDRNYKIIRIESLKNKAWDDAFESVQHWIITEIKRAKGGQNINSNNKLLFHGSRGGTEGIKQSGFDSRFFASYGYYGRGAYFADDPQHSHDGYTAVNPKTNCRQMFVVMVALGEQQELKEETKDKRGPNKGFHSICGFDRGHGEYIIERWGQAKPLYLISYQQ